MKKDWNIHELVIFSVENFTFGVDANQIREIVTIKHPELLIDPDETYPFILVQYHKRPLPIFSIMKQFRKDGYASVSFPFPPFRVVTFFRIGLLMACFVDDVEGVMPVSFVSLKPIPVIMIRAAQKGCVWGFYDMAGKLVPLIDFEQVVTEQDIVLYHQIRKIRSSL